MTDERDKHKDNEGRAGGETESTEETAPPADEEPESNLLPRQIDDQQDSTWFLTP